MEAFYFAGGIFVLFLFFVVVRVVYILLQLRIKDDSFDDSTDERMTKLLEKHPDLLPRMVASQQRRIAREHGLELPRHDTLASLAEEPLGRGGEAEEAFPGSLVIQDAEVVKEGPERDAEKKE